jgi:erythronate-4-phosphate dehydrogenase
VNVVACSNMPFAAEAFSTLGNTRVLDGRAIGRADLAGAEVLAVRSTTRVGPALLEGTPVRFVGTATIGTDHLDIPWLERQGIRWCCAPGCNAESVADYFVSALLCLAARRGWTLAGMTLGVVGVGHVGSRVARRARALGLRVLLNDPPRQRAEPARAGEFVGLDALLAESDLVTLHVPLTRTRADATAGLAGEDFFRRMRRGAAFFNTARGGVMDADALLVALRAGRVGAAVVDTWPGEPVIRRDLLERVDLGTPHIAGHSFDGKVRGTEMVYEEACRFAGRDPAWSPRAAVAGVPAPLVRAAAADAGRLEEGLWTVVRQVYDVSEDDARLRAGPAEPDGWAAHFDRLRREYPRRREFRFAAADLGALSAERAGLLQGAGFAGQ